MIGVPPAFILDFRISPNFDQASMSLLYPRTGLRMFDPSEGGPNPTEFIKLAGINGPVAAASTSGYDKDVVAITVNELISLGRRFAVLRAFDGKRKVVVKLSLWNRYFLDLQTEANNYQRLSDLQGKSIPSCYGFFRDLEDPEFEGEPMPVGFLVLEDCGDHLDVGEESFYPLKRAQRFVPCSCFYHLEDHIKLDLLLFSSPLRLKVLSILGEIDRKGLEIPTHEFTADNVVARDEDYRFISLGNLAAHTCGWDGDWRVDSDDPVAAEFKCSLLFARAVKMGFWWLDEGTLFRGFPISSRTQTLSRRFNPLSDKTLLRQIGYVTVGAIDVPDQATCDALLEGQNIMTISWNWNVRVLTKWLREVKVGLDDGESVESLKKTIPEMPANIRRAEELGYLVGLYEDSDSDDE